MSADPLIPSGLTFASLTFAGVILVAGGLVLASQARLLGDVPAHPSQSDLHSLTTGLSVASGGDTTDAPLAAAQSPAHPAKGQALMKSGGLAAFGPKPALSPNLTLVPVGPAISLAPTAPRAMSPRLLDLSELAQGTCRPLTATAVCP